VFNIGPLELIIVLIIALLVLGPQRLPDAARSVGKGLREFRGALSMDHDDEDEYESAPPATPQAEPVKTPEQAASTKPQAAATKPPTPAS